MAKTFYFEELTNVGINPYEAVIASSREARRLNQTRLMSDTVEGPDKMTTVALDRVVKAKVEVSYGPEGENKAGDEDHVHHNIDQHNNKGQGCLLKNLYAGPQAVSTAAR